MTSKFQTLLFNNDCFMPAFAPPRIFWLVRERANSGQGVADASSSDVLKLPSYRSFFARTEGMVDDFGTVGTFRNARGKA